MAEINLTPGQKAAAEGLEQLRHERSLDRITAQDNLNLAASKKNLYLLELVQAVEPTADASTVITMVLDAEGDFTGTVSYTL